MPVNLWANAFSLNSYHTIRRQLKPQNEHNPVCPCPPRCEETSWVRRHVLLYASASVISALHFNGTLNPPSACAADENMIERDEEARGILGTFQSLFDPNEKTKSGRMLPKAYLKSAREVVKTLRESLKEDTMDIVKFRKTADAAKESIRDYLSNWRGQPKVAGEESYLELEKAIRSLATFYSKAGPSAVIPEQVRSEILDNLNRAEEYL